MKKDRPMLTSVDADHYMIRLLSGWKSDMIGFHPELEAHFKALDDFPEHRGLVEHTALFPFAELYFLSEEMDAKVKETGIAKYGIEGFRVRVFHNHVGLEIRPHEITEELVPSFFNCDYYIDRDTKTRLLLHKIDETAQWPSFSSTSARGRPWVAVRHLNGLRVLKPPCPCCNHRWGAADSVETSFQMILVVWGTGKNILGAGYQIWQTIAEVTGEPFNIW